MYKKVIVGRGGISAKIVEDSITQYGQRLTTMELRFHRFILPEWNTHRMFSRNASSSRAIPVAKMIDQVVNDTAYPIHYGKNQPGMQAQEENMVEDEHYSGYVLFPYEGGTADAPMLWINEAQYAANNAKLLSDAGYHKQIVNRLTEPFQFTKVVVTATEWSNFFSLRLHPAAQPEIAELAWCMKTAMDSNTPVQLLTGEWHLPYVQDYAVEELETMIKASVARCARVSYLNHDNTKPDIDKDVGLYTTLLEARHMSPFEHQATPMMYDVIQRSTHEWEDGVTHIDRFGYKWSNNFRGWKQYRSVL